MTLLLEGIRIALSALWANKLRTLLTLLGTIVGIMSVIAVVSLLGGVDRYMRQEVASEGSNVFTVQRINFLEAITDFESFTDAMKYNPKIEKEDVEYLRSYLQLADVISARVTTTGRVSVRNKVYEGIEVRGRDHAYASVENIPLYAGRHFTPIESREKSQVVVLGWEVYQELLYPRNPVGQLIRLRDRHFKVVGVAAQKSSILGQNRNRFAIVPLGAFEKVYGLEQPISIQVRVDDIRQMDAALNEARVAMRIRHGLRPTQADDFFVSTSEQLIQIWRNISSGVMAALIALVSISMLVGGIVLMNTMLVSVNERTREVGVRKALGARRLAIVWQFLVESATLSVVGGVVGMIIGFGVASIISFVSPIPYTVNAVMVAVAFLVTLLIGLVFGTYPALRAARLDPVDALRAE